MPLQHALCDLAVSGSRHKIGSMAMLTKPRECAMDHSINIMESRYRRAWSVSLGWDCWVLRTEAQLRCFSIASESFVLAHGGLGEQEAEMS
jgi:hypothetical protein